MFTGIVSRNSEGLFRYQAWPTVCRDGSRIYAACSGHRLAHICPFGKDLLYHSDDGGKTWSAPRIVNDTPLDDRDAGITALGGGKLLLTWFNHPRAFYLDRRGKLGRDAFGGAEGLTDAMLDVWAAMPDEHDRPGSYLRLSADRGASWGPAIHAPVTSPHGPLLLSDGRLLWLGKEFFSGQYETGAIYAFESRDGGESWQMLAQLETPEGFDLPDLHEPHAAELPDGRIMGVIRVQHRYDDGRRVFTAAKCFSDDGGKTWTRPELTGVNGSPPHLLVHSSGAVVMVYGRREAPFGERARVSLDGGATFGDELVIGDEAESSDLGYPSSVELDDGRILTVYYQKLPGDPYASILYTVWDLPGVEAKPAAAIRPGRYRHFKGGEYEVLCTARHSETGEDTVVYRALYGEGQVWVRPASMWNETVRRGGKAIQRFTYIGNEAEK